MDKNLNNFLLSLLFSHYFRVLIIENIQDGDLPQSEKIDNP